MQLHTNWLLRQFLAYLLSSDSVYLQYKKGRLQHGSPISFNNINYPIYLCKVCKFNQMFLKWTQLNTE